jgi:xylulokinase
MHDRLILSHNLGTTGNKAVIYDEKGMIVSSWLSLYSSIYSRQNCVEQDPLDWWKAVCDSTKMVLRGINEKSISVVTFSGQMMSCLCLDKAGDTIGNSIIWADMRSYKESKMLMSQIDEDLFFHITGHRISPSYTLSKLLWVMNNRPEQFQRTSKVLQAKDYIVYRLTGNIVTDYSDASGTNLFNLSKRQWSRTLTSIIGINPSILPDALPSTEIAGYVSLEAAGATGLLPGTPVVIGAGDGVCASIAGGCTTEDDSYLYYGSSAWIGLTKKKPFWDPQMRTFNWAFIQPDLVAPCGTMQAAGASLDWLKEELAHEECSQGEIQSASANDLIENEVSRSPVGANGIIFLPHLMGERSPYWSPSAKGAFLGLRKNTTRADLFRACYEGVALNLKIIWEVFKPINKSTELVLIGGQASSEVNNHIIADAFGITVATHNHLKDSKNFGAAIIGGIGIGMYENLNVVKNFLQYERRIEPNPLNTEYYDKILPIYQQAYSDLVNLNSRIDQITNEMEGAMHE